jgi:hypothetical protein
MVHGAIGALRRLSSLAPDPIRLALGCISTACLKDSGKLMADTLCGAVATPALAARDPE